MLQLAYAELFDPPKPAAGAAMFSKADALRKAAEAGSLRPELHLAIDAASVYTATIAAEVTDPAESSLKLHLLCIREALKYGRLSALWWFDTRDMLADGLTKGTCERDPLRKCMEDGHFQRLHESKVQTCGRQRGILDTQL